MRKIILIAFLALLIAGCYGQAIAGTQKICACPDGVHKTVPYPVNCAKACGMLVLPCGPGPAGEYCLTALECKSCSCVMPIGAQGEAGTCT